MYLNTFPPPNVSSVKSFPITVDDDGTATFDNVSPVEGVTLIV